MQIHRKIDLEQKVQKHQMQDKYFQKKKIKQTKRANNDFGIYF